MNPASANRTPVPDSAPETRPGRLSSPRRWEVDAARGVAVVAMVAFHLTHDLAHFGTENIRRALAVPRDWWLYGGAVIGGSFLFISGIAAWLRLGTPGSNPWGPFLKSGGRIGGVAMAITGVTLFAIPAAPIYFGILHCIAVSQLLVPAFRRFRWQTIVAQSTGIIAFGAWLNFQEVETPWLLWLGMAFDSISMSDYFPLLPWFGVMLLGMGAAKWRYGGPISSPAVPEGPTGTGWLGWLGRHSLSIYVIHQPVLFGLLRLLGLVGPELKAEPYRAFLSVFA